MEAAETELKSAMKAADKKRVKRALQGIANAAEAEKKRRQEMQVLSKAGSQATAAEKELKAAPKARKAMKRQDAVAKRPAAASNIAQDAVAKRPAAASNIAQDAVAKMLSGMANAANIAQDAVPKAASNIAQDAVAKRRSDFWKHIWPRWRQEVSLRRNPPEFRTWVCERARMQGVEDPFAPEAWS